MSISSSFSALNRVLEPSVMMELKLSDGKIHTFEVRDPRVLDKSL